MSDHRLRLYAPDDEEGLAPIVIQPVDDDVCWFVEGGL